MAKYALTDFTDIPPDFVADRFSEWITYATGSVIIRAQYVERVLNGICLMLQAKGLRFSEEDFLSGDASRLKQTLGLIRNQLEDSGVFDENFIERVREFTSRRNRVVHGLYADSFHKDDDFDISSAVAQEYVEECEWLIHEGPELVEIGFGIYRVFQDWVSPEHPDYEQIITFRKNFDEYLERGLDTITPDLRASLTKRSK